MGLENVEIPLPNIFLAWERVSISFCEEIFTEILNNQATQIQ